MANRTSARDRALEILSAIGPLLRSAGEATVVERSTMTTKRAEPRVTWDMVQHRANSIAIVAVGRALASFYEGQMGVFLDEAARLEIEALTTELTNVLATHGGPRV